MCSDCIFLRVFHEVCKILCFRAELDIELRKTRIQEQSDLPMENDSLMANIQMGFYC